MFRFNIGDKVVTSRDKEKVVCLIIRRVTDESFDDTIYSYVVVTADGDIGSIPEKDVDDKTESNKT
jgi:hypothetical protein